MISVLNVLDDMHTQVLKILNRTRITYEVLVGRALNSHNDERCCYFRTLRCFVINEDLSMLK